MTMQRINSATCLPVLVVLLFAYSSMAHAQRTASSTLHTFLDEVGIMVDGAFISGFDVTEDQLAMNPSLFENHTELHAPVLMPDGTTPVTYNDVAIMNGTMTILDVGEQGTQVTLNLDGLIPGGLYTVWADLYQAPGFTLDFAHELALGALGYDSNNPPANPVEYAGNVIRADTHGHGELDVIQPTGAASWYTVVDGFEVPAYVLDAPVAEFHTVLAYHIDGASWGPRAGAAEGLDAFDETWVSFAGAFVADVSQLVAGDADQDLDFDQLDLVQVQIASKYLTGQAAAWGEGDWDGAPGGSPGSPPSGDDLFNQFDIIAAQQGAAYLTGPYAAIQPNGQGGDGQTSVVYSSATGELSVDAPVGVELTSINIDSSSGIFTGSPAQSLGGSFDNDADVNIFKATFGGSFGSVSFGNAAQTGLSEEFVLNDLSVVGSLAGGGDLGNVDLVYVPEPASACLLALGLVLALSHIRRKTSRV